MLLALLLLELGRYSLEAVSDLVFLQLKRIEQRLDGLA